jgi:hypothetical protein
LELIELNSYRGSHSYSFSTINITTGELTVRGKGQGALNSKHVQFNENEYAIVHIQAPTTNEKTFASIHPAEEAGAYLWHNGIIKAGHVKVLQSRYGVDTSWDTKLLLRAILSTFDELNYMDGSFSCLLHDSSRAYLFRNDISPMFYDKDLSISSTKFEGSIATPSNNLLCMDFNSRCLYNTGTSFRTAENPYYFMD